jgi:hypothetical protein
MKKAILLVFVCLLLAGCADAESSAPASVAGTETQTSSAETTAAATTAAEEAETTTAPVTEPADETDPTADTTAAEPDETEPTDPEPELLAEYNGITITSKGLGFGDQGAAIIVHIDNQSDQDIVVQTRDFTVNDYMTRVAFSPDVLAGKKAKAYIRIFDDELAKNGIKKEEIEDIEFKIRILTPDFDLLHESDVIKWHFSH